MTDAQAESAPSPAADRGPLDQRAQAFIEQINGSASVAQIKAMQMAGLRCANRDQVNYASQIQASCHLLAAALQACPDREAAVLAVTLMVHGHLEKLDTKGEA